MHALKMVCNAQITILKDVTNVHPNIWSLITALKNEEALSTARIAHRNRGDSVTSKKNTGKPINV